MWFVGIHEGVPVFKETGTKRECMPKRYFDKTSNAQIKWDDNFLRRDNIEFRRL